MAVAKDKEEVKEEKKELKFASPVINIRIDNEDYLEVDLLDYFDRLYRQGWGCVKVKKLK
jgi:hypothetical protein